MSFWIHAFCNDTVASIIPDDLKNGIRKRLSLLTFLFCPEQEEDPDVVFRRLRIEDYSLGEPFEDYRMYYKINSPTFIRIERHDRGSVPEIERELASRQQGKAIEDIRQRIRGAKEDVTFCLKADDVTGMGFPLAIAAAAYLVENTGGLIQSGTYSWMVPEGNEVRTLLELDA